MKIAYITEVNITIDSGICKKLQAQIGRWEKMGHEVVVYSLSGIDYSGRRLTLKEQHFRSKIYTLNAPLLKSSVKNFLNKLISGYRLKKDLLAFSPDVVYYRQGMWFPALDAIMEKHPSVMEVNTVDLEEYAHAGYIKRSIYSYGRKRILKRLKGMVCVTEEIRRKYWQYKIPRVVISNGTDLSAVNGTVAAREIREKPQLIFVSTPGMEWQGVDKVLDLAVHLPQFDFHIVGDRPAYAAPLQNVFLYGYLSAGELKQLYGSMDIGIGTMALYRKKMEEACPLKVREYCGYGIPVICAYYDTDLAGKEYVLRLENREDNIRPNITKIKEFVANWRGRRVNTEVFRSFLDTEVKESQRMKFLQQVIAENTRIYDC